MAIQTRMTAKEFLALPESNQPVELIHGEVIMSPTPTPSHQRVVGDVFFFVKQMAKAHGGQAFVAPLDVYLDEENVVQPDVLWIAPDSRCTVGDSCLNGAPDLVIEVLSPSTARRDKTVKFRLYEKHGVREYWMVDPAAQYVEVWQAEAGKFAQKGVYGPGEKFNTAVFPGGEAVDVTAILGG
jgi:Uma2 family endonuclease